MDNNNMYQQDNQAQNNAAGAGPEPDVYTDPAGNVDPNNNQDPYANQDNCAYGQQGYPYPPQGEYQQNGYPQGGYQQELEEPVSMGEWLVSLILIMFVPCVNIVLMFVWAFSKKEKKSKSNFFKAQLILTGIVLVIYIVFIVIFGAAFFAALS